MTVPGSPVDAPMLLRPPGPVVPPVTGAGGALGGIDWTSVLQHLVDQVVQNPAIVQRLFQRGAGPPAFDQPSPQLPRGEPVNARSRQNVQAYKIAIRMIQPDVVKGRALEFAKQLHAWLEAASPADVVTVLDQALDQAYDDDVARLAQIVQLIQVKK